MYDRSIADPEGFWGEVAEDFHWFKKWDKVRSYNYDRREGPSFGRVVQWSQNQCLLQLCGPASRSPRRKNRNYLGRE